MGTAFAVLTYIASALFLIRFAGHLFSWVTGLSMQPGVSSSKTTSLSALAESGLDILFLRRLYRTSRLLWIVSWTFHLSFALVCIRHLRYFLYPVPSAVMSMQAAGTAAGYLLPLSLLLLLLIRMRTDRDRYVSLSNLYLTVTLFIAAVSGLALKLVYRTDLVDVKAFMLGVLAFDPVLLPQSMAFVIHYVIVLLIIPAVPLHMIAAPLITVDARRREEGLHQVIHEK